MDANQAMIEGGGFTASEVSFTLACMKVLNTLRDASASKSWRVLDESDETGNRYVQASMSLIHRRLHGDHHARRGLRPGGCADQGDAAANWRSGTRPSRRCGWAPSASRRIDVSAHDTAAHVRVTVSFHADGHEPRGRPQA